MARRQCQDLIHHHTEAPEDLLFLGDNGFCRRAFIYSLVAEEGTNVVVRLRNNQVVYGPPLPREKGKRGCPRRYGARFALKDPTTWPDPDVERAWDETLASGRQVHIHLKVWYNMRIRGTRQYPMYRCPFTLIQVTITTSDGRPLYHRPLWLTFFGPQRQVWAPKLIYAAYRQRFDQEHMHRFLSQHLLVTAYETPLTDHEERWWRIVSLAKARWHPWAKYLARKQISSQTSIPSPTHVQRDFRRILWQLSSPARRLKPRGKPKGRAPGQRLKPRPRYKIVRKGHKKAA